jgi:excisionase family DNA binding protein
MAKTNLNDREHQIVFESPVDSRAAAAAIGIHYKTLERLARKGLVPATKLGRSWQFRLSILSDWFNGQLKSNSETNSRANEKKEEPP